MEGYAALITTWGTGDVSFDDLTSGLGWEVAARILGLAVRAKHMGTTEVRTYPQACGKRCSRGDIMTTVIDNSSGPSREEIFCDWCGRLLVGVTVTKVECLQGEQLEEAIKEHFKGDFDACSTHY